MLPDRTLGWLGVTSFPADPALPTLPAVLAQPGCPTVLRYRPFRRCTIRFDNAQCMRFAKVYKDDRGACVYHESIALWQAAQRGELEFMVAAPQCWDASTRTLWQGRAPGEPVTKRLFGSEGPYIAYRMGQALASLSRAQLAPSATTDAATQLARSLRHGAELRRRVPRLSEQVDMLLAALAAIHAADVARPPRPIHGAPHPQQWLDDGSRLALVDFDGFARGDPELDLAILLAELDFESKMLSEQLASQLLAGYEHAAGPLNRRLLVAYRAHKSISKVLNAARSVRPDGDARAERKLQVALRHIQNTEL
jgi:hypothetical protein